ncbi:MAG TPA: hypothetical protein VGH16_17740 [Candidatus Binatia bacterium]|jgi:hypothetical protein
MERQKTNFWWPDVSTIDGAKKASMNGVWAAVFTAVVTALVASWALGAQAAAFGYITAWAFLDAILFSVIALGIYKESRFAAVAGLSLFVIEKIDQFSHGPKTSGIIMAIVLTLCYLAAIRGTYALRRLRAAPSMQPAV